MTGLGLIEQMAEHIGHRVTLLGGEDAADGLMCEDCGEYLIEWDDFDPGEQLRGAVEERDRLASALEWAKRSNWIPTRAEVNVARDALGLPPLGGQS
jgi:hypothetical protein